MNDEADRRLSCRRRRCRRRRRRRRPSISSTKFFFSFPKSFSKHCPRNKFVFLNIQTAWIDFWRKCPPSIATSTVDSRFCRFWVSRRCGSSTSSSSSSSRRSVTATRRSTTFQKCGRRNETGRSWKTTRKKLISCFFNYQCRQVFFFPIPAY